MKKEILCSPLALARLQEIRGYSVRDDASAAARVTTRLVSVVQALVDSPLLGREGIAPNTHELVVGGTPYIIHYQANARQLLIRTVWHGAQKKGGRQRDER